MNKLTKYSWAILVVLFLAQWMSCKDDEEEPNVLASFYFEQDANDFKTINFFNASQNFSALSWNFGDGSAASSETNPTHTYASAGTYTVKLTATSTDGSKTDDFTEDVVITDPNAELTKLVGDVSKTWRLLRDVSTGRYPLEVGPWDHSTIWWAMGYNNDELAIRPCILNDDWTFVREGMGLVIDLHGDYWAEGGIYEPANICASTDQMLGPNGEDLSAWGGGNFTFELNTTGTEPKLKAVGLGAYLGLSKLGNGTEVKVPQEYVEYTILKLTDDNVDTLIVEGHYQWDETDGGYWRFILVHYDNPAEEPPIPSPSPGVGFDMVVEGATITCTNTTTYGVSYVWDFGNGETSTSTDVVYTYPNDGFYNVTLTATNANGSASLVKAVFISVNTPALTDDLLQGAAWKVVVAEKTVFVGPALGNGDWWALPKSFLDGTGTGGDDWSCMADDEFTFSLGGDYIYDGKGMIRNDGYFGSPNGCIDEATLSGNGLYFASGTHTYTFTPASGSDRPIIVLTNGANRAAFLGFYKGYYGGENIDGANPPNGGNLTNRYEVMGYAQGATKEYLFISVDISADHSGTAAWSVILER